MNGWGIILFYLCLLLGDYFGCLLGGFSGLGWSSVEATECRRNCVRELLRISSIRANNTFSCLLFWRRIRYDNMKDVVVRKKNETHLPPRNATRACGTKLCAETARNKRKGSLMLPTNTESVLILFVERKNLVLLLPIDSSYLRRSVSMS